MHVKRCDNCGREDNGVDSGFWHNVTPERAVVGQPESYDFCSWRCEGEYALKKAAEEARPRRVNVTITEEEEGGR